MSTKDGKPEPQGKESQADEVSATGFYRAFHAGEPEPESWAGPGAERPSDPLPDVWPDLMKKAAAPAQTPDAGLAGDEQAGAGKPMPPSAPAQSSAPGEFTQFFRPQAARPGEAGEPSAAAPDAFMLSNRGGSAGPAQADFNRVEAHAPGFSSRLPAEAPAASPFTAPPAASAGAAAAKHPRLKGFSTPGGSDAASIEGSSTQSFSPHSGGATASARPPVNRYAAPAPNPSTPPASGSYAPKDEFKWPQEPVPYGLPARETPGGSDSSSATGVLSPFSAKGSYPPERSDPFPGGRVEPMAASVDSVSPASGSQPAGLSATNENSVTRLIQRLSDTQRFSTAAPPPVQDDLDLRPQVAPQPSSTEPSEYTRIMKNLTAKAAPAGGAGWAAPAQPTLTPFALPQPALAQPAFAQPALAQPALAQPTLSQPGPAPAAPPAPAVHFPAVATPAVPLPRLPEVPLAVPKPALAAPKSRMEELIPILLIVNTFLLMVILLVLIFALKGK